jgi:hypothetical protein
MNRIVVQSRVGSDGILHLSVPIGDESAHKDVRVTVEPVGAPGVTIRPTMTAAALLRSGILGIWADRTDIGDSRQFAQRLRDSAQTRSVRS